MADTKKDTRLQEALDRFKLVCEAEAEQRKQEEADLEFVDLDKQWPQAVIDQRSGNTTAMGGQPPVPARPCLVFNKIRPSVSQVTNQQRNARLALNFSPKRDGASQDVAEAMEDIARGIQTESRAHLARNWAYDRAVKGGRGYYRILTEYANDGDDDLDIVYKRILNQSSVYFDPFSQEPDWSDAEWCLLTEDMPWTRYVRLFGESTLAGYDDTELVGLGDDQPEWVGGDDESSRTVRVAEYWYVEYAKRQVPSEIEPSGVRTIQQRTVKFCKINGVEILEASDWPGRYIPIIPVIGEESNINGKRAYQGLVRPAKDAQRSYNYMRSAEVETIGLAPRAPFIIEEGQIEGYEAMWQQANTRNFPYLVFKRTTLDGSPGNAPQRNAVEPPIQAIAMAVREADGDIKGTLGIFDPSLGALSSGERSGKAILALQKQAETGTSGFLDNLAQMSMVYEGKVLRDLIPKVYTRPGRLVATVGADEERGAVIIGKPFVIKDGEPIEAPPGTPGARTLDLSQGEYTVTATVGKSFSTRREEGAAAMGELASAAPNLLPLFADLYVGNLDFPGARAIADRLKKVLPPQVQESDSPELQLARLTEQAQQAQQVLDALSKELTEKNKVIETDAVKRNYDLKQTEMELTSKEKIETMKIEADLLKTQATIAAQQANISLEAQIQEIQQELGFLREKELLAAQQAQEAALQGAQQQADAQQQGAEQQFEGEQAEQDRGLQAGMQEQQLAAQQAQAEQQPAGR